RPLAEPVDLLRAYGGAGDEDDARGNWAQTRRVRVLVWTVALQVPAAVRSSICTDRARRCQLPVRVHRPAGHPADQVPAAIGESIRGSGPLRRRPLRDP